MTGMADDRSITGSATPGGAAPSGDVPADDLAENDVHDDDELAEALAAELERYATGAVPVLPRPSIAREQPVPPVGVPGVGPQQRTPATGDPRPVESAFARRAAEVEQAMRDTRPTPTVLPTTAPTAAPAARDDAAASAAFRRADRPSGRRSATGPVVQPGVLPTVDDLPVRRRTGFRPPPVADPSPAPTDPIDRVLPSRPITLPEPTASLLDTMVADARTGPATTGEVPTGPMPASPVRTGPMPTGPAHLHGARHAAPLPDSPTRPGDPAGPGSTGPLALPDGLYEDWEQSLRSIGRPPSPWDIDDEVVPTGGDASLPTVAVPIQPNGLRRPPSEEESRPAALHQQEPPAPAEIPSEIPSETRGRRSGRRHAAAPPDPSTDAAAPVPSSAPLSSGQLPPAAFGAPAAREPLSQRTDIDEEGIDEIAVDYPVVSAATTGAIDVPVVEPRPRTAPVLIERVRTALLQLPTVPLSPTGSGAAAIVGRWVGAFASPLLLLLAFGLAGAGGGTASGPAVVAGALLAVPAVLRSAAWSARTFDDAAVQEVAVLGTRAGRAEAVLLLLLRLGAAVAVLFLIGSLAGAWADRTGALGLSASNAPIVGAVTVGVLALLCGAWPTRATAALVLLAAVLGATGTLLIALVLAPNGGAAGPTTASGAVAGAVAGFVGIGLLLVLCGADVARWRTDHAHPVSTAVGSVVALLGGGVLIAAAAGIAARLSGTGDPVDEFAGALSDASASLLAGPILIVLLVAALTLPALLLRSAGASAARLLGAGRPVRLGTIGAGLLALAGALGLLAAGTDPAVGAVAAAAFCGVPIAAWAGLLVTTSSARRPGVAAAGLAVATVVGWLLCDGLIPGVASPLLDALGLPASTGLRGGPAVGAAAALLLGIASGALGGRGPRSRSGSTAGPADTVEG